MVKRNRVQQFFTEPSMTQQQFKDTCDINNIVAKYKRTGVIDHVNRKQPIYGDFTNVTSYLESLEIVQKADEMFSALPAQVRARFQNDPSKLLAFMEDSRNYEEAVKLGLLPSQEPLKADDGQASALAKAEA